LDYGYDLNDRLKTIKEGLATFGLDYDELDRRVSLTMPNGVQGTYQYDSAGRLTGLSYAKSTTGQKQNYLYEGSDILEESGAKIASYTHGPGTDEPFLCKSTTKSEYYLADVPFANGAIGIYGTTGQLTNMIEIVRRGGGTDSFISIHEFPGRPNLSFSAGDALRPFTPVN